MLEQWRRADLVADLRRGKVHLWCCPVSKAVSESLLNEYRRILSPVEQEKETRFRFSKDRIRYVMTRVLQRQVLSQYEDIGPQDWHFTTNPFGRPALDERHSCARILSFNVSYTDGMIAIAVACGRDIGIDLENMDARLAPLDVGLRFFAPEEVASLAALPRHLQQRRFFEYWTLKEAYSKARGMGLSLPLDQARFSFPEVDRVELRMPAGRTDAALGWFFWQISLGCHHIASLCAGRSLNWLPRIEVYGVTPTLAKFPIAYSVVRSSRQSGCTTPEPLVTLPTHFSTRAALHIGK